MANNNALQVVSANHLLEGGVVYLAADNQWTRDLASAHIISNQADANASVAIATAQHDRVVEPYLVDVELDASGTPRPRHIREAIRDSGPTVARWQTIQ